MIFRVVLLIFAVLDGSWAGEDAKQGGPYNYFQGFSSANSLLGSTYSYGSGLNNLYKSPFFYHYNQPHNQKLNKPQYSQELLAPGLPPMLLPTQSVSPLQLTTNNLSQLSQKSLLPSYLTVHSQPKIAAPTPLQPVLSSAVQSIQPVVAATVNPVVQPVISSTTVSPSPSKQVLKSLFPPARLPIGQPLSPAKLSPLKVAIQSESSTSSSLKVAVDHLPVVATNKDNTEKLSDLIAVKQDQTNFVGQQKVGHQVVAELTTRRPEEAGRSFGQLKKFRFKHHPEELLALKHVSNVSNTRDEQF